MTQTSYWKVLVEKLELGITQLREALSSSEERAAASPFGYLSIAGRKLTIAQRPLPLTPLDLTKEALFPVSDRTADADRSLLLRQFDAELSRIPTRQDAAWVYTILHLLKKYGSSIRSSAASSPYVNLYAHTRTSAALTVCRNQSKAIDYGLMVCIDLSGIQAFIYDVSSAKAYKSLKGRSYFVQAFLTQCTDRLLREAGLTHANLLYESGGKAFCLLPNNPEVIAAIDRAHRAMERQAYYVEGGTIYPAIGHVAFGDDTDLGELWKSVNDAAAAQKALRYRRLLIDDFDEFFSEDSDTARAATQATHICAVSGQAIPIGKGKQLDQDSEQRVLERVYGHIELGRKLKQTEYTLRGMGSSAGRTSFEALDSHLTLTEAHPTPRPSQFQERLNATDFLPDRPTDGVGYGFSFYGGNEQPGGANERQVASLEDLCRIEQDKFAPLGVLRMDVDGLGQVFIKGITDKSFAAYLTVSDRLAVFFSGYLNEIRSRRTYRDCVALLYAGGDDLFVVGRWDATLAFAEEVREEFREFTGRDDLSVSGGLFITHHKYPIYRAAAEAGEMEHRAKQHEYKHQKKNAITIFGQPLNWEGEYPLVKQLKTSLVRHIENGLSRAVLHHLRETYTLAQPDVETGTVDLSYKWQSAYRLDRLADRYKKQPEIRDFVKELNQDLLHHSTGANYYLTLAAVAARWAEYEINFKPDGLQ